MRTTPNKTIYEYMVAAAREWKALDNAHAIMSDTNDICEECLGYIKGVANEREAVAVVLLDILALRCPACKRELTPSDFWGESAACFKCGTILAWTAFEEGRA